MDILAIVPARGGSKGIPRKNVKMLGDYPLIAYSIAAGLQSKQITRLIVSTDNEEIANVARKYGAELPFMRPIELAQDLTPDFPVFEHALHWFAEHESYYPEIIVQLRPTVPLRPLGLIDKAIQALIDNPEASCVRTITEAHETPYKMWKRDTSSSYITPVLELEGRPQAYNLPRQLLPKVYLHSGHLDVIRRETILEDKSMSGNYILPYEIEADYAVDIDTPEHWQQAESYLAKIREQIYLPL